MASHVSLFRTYLVSEVHLFLMKVIMYCTVYAVYFVNTWRRLTALIIFFFLVNKYFWLSSVSVIITTLEFVDVLMVFSPLHCLTLPFWISITGLESALMLYASFWYNETLILHWVWSTIVISFISRYFQGTGLISDSDNIIPLVLMTVYVCFQNFLYVCKFCFWF